MEASKYNKGKKIGEGTFGKVFLVSNKSNGEKYVMKEMKINEEQTLEEVQRESEI